MARPTIMTPDILGKLEYAFSIGCSDLEACFYADIGKTTLYNYQEKHPEFVDRKELLKDRPVLLARESVINHMQDDGKLAMDFLKNKKRDEFNTKETKELTGKDGKDLINGININFVKSADGDKS